jgi:hypothetical protein
MDRPLTAADLHDAVFGTFDPVLTAVGFVWATDLKWVRSVDGEIRHVVEAFAGRHGARVPRWGVSLDFVPHVVGSAIRWHRTLKTARIDLGYEPHNFQDEWDFEGQSWVIWPNLGHPTPAERAASIAEQLGVTALPWLDRIDGLLSLPAAFEREEAREGGQFGFDNYIQYRLAYAFTLARLGREDRAEAEFARWVAATATSPDVRSTLRELLRATTPG